VAKVWQALLTKEWVATIVGSLILVLFAGSVVWAMFSHTQVTEIVSNAFLVLLGYFFGQTVARGEHRPERRTRAPAILAGDGHGGALP
jgi:hypothetical protein